MGICVIYKCNKPTDGDRMLCTKHAAIGLMMRADGKCQKCFVESTEPPGLLCRKCEAERQAIKNATS